MGLYSAYSGESIGRSISGMGNIRTDPYTLPSVRDVLPDASSIAMLPFKLSLYANTLRSAWYGLGYVGSTASRFSPNRLKWKYRATTVNGLLGDTLEAGQRTISRLVSGEAFTFNRWKDMKAGVKSVYRAYGGRLHEYGPGGAMHQTLTAKRGGIKAAFQEARAHLRHTGWQKELDPWRLIHSPAREKDIMSLGGNWSMGFLDKFYLSPKNINRNLADLLKKGVISDEIYDTLIEDSKFTKDLARELYGGGLRRRDSGTGAVIEKTIVGRGRADSVNRKQLREHYKKVLKDSNTVSLWDVIKGQRDVKGTFWEKRKGFFFGEDRVRFTRSMTGARPFTGMKSTFMFNKASYGRMHGNVSEAAMRVLRDSGVANIASKDLQSAVSNMASTTISRVRAAKLLRGIGVTAFVIPEVLRAGLGAYKLVTEVASRTAPTIRRLTRMDFGAGDVLSNARVSTERQRAVAAIQSAHMNARYLMGNEAPMYH